MSDPGIASEQGLRIPIEYVCEGVRTEYATNLVVQHTEHEFVLSFYRIQSPIIIGSRDERERQIEGMRSVQADCVARIVVAPGRMPDFVIAIQGNLDKHRERFGESEPIGSVES